MGTATAKRAAKSKKPESIETRIAKHKRALELGRKHYGRADALMEGLLPELTEKCEACGGVRPKADPVILPGGKKARLTDLYAEKNKVYRAHGIGRYDLEVKDAE